jgi:hypothetical protein
MAEEPLAVLLVALDERVSVNRVVLVVRLDSLHHEPSDGIEPLF